MTEKIEGILRAIAISITLICLIIYGFQRNDNAIEFLNYSTTTVKTTAASAKQAKININTASEDELKTLVGIGDDLSRAIVEYRTKHPFNKIDEIMKVKGIGQAKYLKIKDSIVV